MDETISTETDSTLAPAQTTSDYLFRVFSCDQPLIAPARHVLSNTREVLLVRGEKIEALREADKLILMIPDRRMSNPHARLLHSNGQWTLEDLQSRNGTFMEGTAIRSTVLDNDTWFECGRTFFRYRKRLNLHGENPDSEAVGLTPAVQTTLPTFAKDLERLRKIAESRVPIVLYGETGTGKEVFARAIHALSGRRGAFVAVNCPALPATLVESELFGYRRGAFSGATEDRLGLLRSADGGTVMLDEIGDLTPTAQASILRALQEREVLPVGATRPVPIDFRLIVAGQKPLEDLVRHGRFRADLHARAAGYTLRLPPLRERIEDFGIITASLLTKLSATPERMSFTRASARALLAHDYPLNVRELERALEAAVVLAGNHRIDTEHLPDSIQGGANRHLPSATPIDANDPEQKLVVGLLVEHKGNISAMARAAGKERVQIRRWLKRFGLDPQRFR